MSDKNSFFDALDKLESQRNDAEFDRIAKLKHTNNLIIEKLDDEKTSEMTKLSLLDVGAYSENYVSYVLPNDSYLEDGVTTQPRNERYISNVSQQLLNILTLYDIDAKFLNAYQGPRKTVFEFSLDTEIDAALITKIEETILENELSSKIIVTPLYQRDTLGIIVPNETLYPVHLKELFEPYKDLNHSMRFLLGKRNNGMEALKLQVFQNLFVLGTTSGGKSMLLHSIILSVLLQAKPDQIKLLLIDPKKSEFTPYRNLPHLIAPVVNRAEISIYIFKYVIRLMQKRLEEFKKQGVNDIEQYNALEQVATKMPQLIVLVDELSDIAKLPEFSSTVEEMLELAQNTGVHLVFATNNADALKDAIPLIRDGFNRKVCFYHIKTKVTSRLLNSEFQTADLLGEGDMVYFFPESKYPLNMQGAHVSNDEIKRLSEYCASQGTPMFDEVFLEDIQ